MSSIMRSELERLAAVAVAHGRDDPALDVFLVLVGALDPLPDAATLRPAARRIGKLRLAQALDRPGEPRLGACRLMAAALAAPIPFPDPPPTPAPDAPVEPLPAHGRGLPEMAEALLQAIRGALSIFV